MSGISEETLAWLRELHGRFPLVPGLPPEEVGHPTQAFWDAVEERRRRDEEDAWRDKRAVERLWAWLGRLGIEPPAEERKGRKR